MGPCRRLKSDMSWKNELIKLVKDRVKEDEPLAKHTTFRIGGPCDVFFEPSDIDDLAAGLGFLREEKIPHVIAGQGSNLLFEDAGYRGCVLRIGRGSRRIEIDGDRAVGGSGVFLHLFVQELASKGLSGLEGLAGIPGTIGGALCMNAGAFGQTISDCLEWVEIIDETGTMRRLDKKNLLFRYRWSIFQKIPDWVIVSAGFKLKQDQREAIEERLEDFAEKRKKTQPWNYPSAGSFFKNPEGRSAGALIDHAGLKGHRIGGAMVSEVHTNFIVNVGGATSSDIVALMNEIQQVVQDREGVRLEPEVRIIPSSRFEAV